MAETGCVSIELEDSPIDFPQAAADATAETLESGSSSSDSESDGVEVTVCYRRKEYVTKASWDDHDYLGLA